MAGSLGREAVLAMLRSFRFQMYPQFALQIVLAVFAGDQGISAPQLSKETQARMLRRDAVLLVPQSHHRIDVGRAERRQ